jgi:glycosyltransferase involved in cell wall biosynthesis
VETLLEAVKGLREEYDDFRLFMLGGKWRGAEDYYDGLKRRAHELGLDDKVLWLGYLPDGKVSEYLSMTDIFIVPFDNGISVRRGSYMAGLAHGLATISTYADIDSEYIRDGENIALVPPRDAAALKAKILELIKDPEKRKLLADNSRRLLEEFSWPKIASRTVQIFEKVKC